MIYLFLSPATTVGIVNPPFSYGMGQRHVLGQLRVAGAAMCFTAGRIDSVTPRLRCAQPRLVGLRCPRPRAGPPPVTFLPPGTEAEGMISSTGSSIPMDTLRISPVDICGRPHILRQSFRRWPAPAAIFAPLRVRHATAHQALRSDSGLRQRAGPGSSGPDRPPQASGFPSRQAGRTPRPSLRGAGTALPRRDHARRGGHPPENQCGRSRLRARALPPSASGLPVPAKLPHAGRRGGAGALPPHVLGKGM